MCKDCRIMWCSTCTKPHCQKHCTRCGKTKPEHYWVFSYQTHAFVALKPPSVVATV